MEQVAAFSLQLRHEEGVGTPARALDALTKGGGDCRSAGGGVRPTRPSGETPAFLGERAVTGFAFAVWLVTLGPS